MQAQPQLIIPTLARRYVAWTERGVIMELEEMLLTGLQEWDRPVELPDGVEVLPLSACGSELLLKRLYNECNADGPDFRRAGYLQVLALRAAPYHDAGGILVARADGRPVGFCIGRRRRPEQGLVNGLAVHPEYRGRGIGRALLRSALMYLRTYGASEALIRVHPENHRGRALYESEGFRRL
jgi:ribosomal protein S18 acetylase RimI-like enzyme